MARPDGTTPESVIDHGDLAPRPPSGVAILPSRLSRPIPRVGIVHRRAVLERLSHAQGVSVAAIVAPAGYGKTSVLIQWLNYGDRRSAWLSFDRTFDDPAVLITYLAHALAQIINVDEAVFQGLAAPHPTQRRAILASLASSISTTTYPFLLAVDDAHLLTNGEGIDIVRTLVDHLPAGSQIALAGRHEPRLGLPRWRAEGKVVDISQDDLRLDAEDVAALLAANGAELSDREVVHLAAHTEGWAVAVYLAALARKDGSGRKVRATTFGGDDRLLSDYMRTEFLDRLPAASRWFLVQTALLDELCGPLCDAVLAQSGSAALLEELEASNLLIVPLDRQRRWYRYHHLFQETLRYELERTASESIPSLARRASQWCETEGLIDQAIHYMQLAGNVLGVAQLVMRNGMRQYAAGRAVATASWFDWLTKHGSIDGGVAVLATWQALLAGRAAEAERWAAVSDLGKSTVRLPDGSPLDAWVLTMRAAMALDIDQMRSDARSALDLLSPSSQWRPTAAYLLGTAELLSGDLDAADVLFADGAELGVVLGAPVAASVSWTNRATIAIRRGRWDKAQAMVESALSLIRRAHLESYSTSALTYAIHAQVAIHRGDVRLAIDELHAAEILLPLLTRALAPLAVQTRLELIRAYLRLGDIKGADERLVEVQDLLHLDRSFGLLEEEAEELSMTVSESHLISPGGVKLTPAELRLLPHLATQFSFQEIAEQFFVSVHTVKAQVTSIYRKLGATSRTQAIERARTLGLLADQ
jgi:LuxR family transcriptional regulator, maltose regulon positive regulatory protein